MPYYSDFDFDLDKISTGDITTLTDEESINQSIKNILFTNRGEVFFEPLFGSGINKLLFEKINPVTEYLLKKEIRYAVENYEPRIKINNISIEPNYDDQEYYVDIDYVIIKLNTLGNVEISLQLQGI